MILSFIFIDKNDHIFRIVQETTFFVDFEKDEASMNLMKESILDWEDF